MGILTPQDYEPKSKQKVIINEHGQQIRCGRGIRNAPDCILSREQYETLNKILTKKYSLWEKILRLKYIDVGEVAAYIIDENSVNQKRAMIFTIYEYGEKWSLHTSLQHPDKDYNSVILSKKEKQMVQDWWNIL